MVLARADSANGRRRDNSVVNSNQKSLHFVKYDGTEGHSSSQTAQSRDVGYGALGTNLKLGTNLASLYEVVL